MNEYDVVEWAETKGAEDGAKASRYAPPIIIGIVPVVDEAYASHYFNALAYEAPWPGGSAR